jgi:hypothetical protein
MALAPADEARRFWLEPWPFGEDHVAVHCDGRRLSETFDGEEEMRSALDAAPWERVEFELLSR